MVKNTIFFISFTYRILVVSNSIHWIVCMLLIFIWRNTSFDWNWFSTHRTNIQHNTNHENYTQNIHFPIDAHFLLFLVSLQKNTKFTWLLNTNCIITPSQNDIKIKSQERSIVKFFQKCFTFNGIVVASAEVDPSIAETVNSLNQFVAFICSFIDLNA